MRYNDMIDNRDFLHNFVDKSITLTGVFVRINKYIDEHHCKILITDINYQGELICDHLLIYTSVNMVEQLFSMLADGEEQTKFPVEFRGKVTKYKTRKTIVGVPVYIKNFGVKDLKYIKVNKPETIV